MVFLHCRAEDHGATESVYLRDPDGNGVELYYDRPREEWFDAKGRWVLKRKPFDARELLPQVCGAVAYREIK
jgi:catechol 2,3-dioxygenase